MKFIATYDLSHYHLSCPLCGNRVETGGTETGVIDSIDETLTICSDCADNRKRNDEQGLRKRIIAFADRLQEQAKSLYHLAKTERFEFPLPEEYERAEKGYNEQVKAMYPEEFQKREPFNPNAYEGLPF